MAVQALASASAIGPGLRAELVDCWVEVTNTGGAVGFPFPPVEADDVGPAVDELFASLDPARCVLFLARVEGSESLAGWVVLRRRTARVAEHVGWVERLQTSPAARGHGIGAGLLAVVEEYAAGLGLRQLHLTARGGLGLESYYTRLGWTEIGRWPGALWLGGDDFRDDVLLWKALDTR